MSRCKVKAVDNDCAIFIGLDSMLGDWFFQKFAVHPKTGEQTMEYLLDTRSKSKIVDLLHVHCDMSDSYTAACVNAIACDVDPGKVKYNV